MRTFKDINNREWIVAVTVDTVRRVRALAGVDLLGLPDGKLAEKLAGDAVLLVDTLYAACKPQAEKDGITDVQFGESLIGDSLDAATTALVEATVDFFPSRQQALIRQMQAKGLAVRDATARLATARIDAIDPEAEAEKLLPPPTSTPSAGSSPASSALTPDPEP